MNVEPNQSNEAWLTEYVETLARERDAFHVDTKTNKQSLRGDGAVADVIGLAGEMAFGRKVGTLPDLADRRGGDNGVDFVLPLCFTVDVKTARKAGNLIQPQGKVRADIYVLAQWDDDSKAVALLGWEWGAKLRAAPVRDFGYGVLNHYIPKTDLRPMDELVNRVGKITPVKIGV